MGVKKVKISAVKRSAHLKNKKTPPTKLQKLKQQQKSNTAEKKHNTIFAHHRTAKLAQRKKGHNQPSVPPLTNTDAASSDEDAHVQLASQVAGMLDDDDMELLLANGAKRQRKRKHDHGTVEQDSVGLERAYAAQSGNERRTEKVKINLLPIKSREGEIIVRTTEVDYKSKPKSAKLTDDVSKVNNDDADSSANVSIYADSDDDIVNEDNDGDVSCKTKTKLISTTDLLIARQQEIERQKYRIGIICSGILEKPEDKMRNFKALFELMDDTNATGAANLLTVRKVSIISLTEVFKDILPEYRVGQVDTKMQTVRKATLERVTYENALLQQFKKFLQKLEALTAAVTKRGGHNRITPQSIKMAEVAVQSLCDILVAHSYFNYVQNVAQLLVYMLNSNFAALRTKVNKCFRTIFANDKKFDMSLFIVRRINHLIKMKKNNVHLECVTCLLALKIKNVNLDAEKQNELKQKKLEAHRQRLMNFSKKERKRRKKLSQLNKELEETRAEENKQTKHYKLTEIIKMVFTIYFRILKNDPTSRVLSAILEGLAEFAHIINVDFFADLIDVLNGILEERNIGYREQLHCIQTIFIILAGQGEVLNIDPIRFYQHFYKNMLAVHAGKNHDDYSIILRTLDEVLVKRRRNMSQQRLMAFIKRLANVSLHLLPHGALASLGTIKTTFQLTAVLDILLDTDTSIGSGRYDPELDEPEYCNAACTALYELSLLTRHYHPTVRKMARHIANGVPASGDGSLPSEIGKLTSHELFEQYDSTQMAFNPSIPVPNIKAEVKIKKKEQSFLNTNFKSYYSKIRRRELSAMANVPNCIEDMQHFDFYAELNANKNE